MHDARFVGNIDLISLLGQQYRLDLGAGRQRRQRGGAGADRRLARQQIHLGFGLAQARDTVLIDGQKRLGRALHRAALSVVERGDRLALGNRLRLAERQFDRSLADLVAGDRHEDRLAVGAVALVERLEADRLRAGNENAAGKADLAEPHGAVGKAESHVVANDGAPEAGEPGGAEIEIRHIDALTGRDVECLDLAVGVHRDGKRTILVHQIGQSRRLAIADAGATLALDTAAGEQRHHDLQQEHHDAEHGQDDA